MSVSPQTKAVLTALETSLPKTVSVITHQLSYPAPSVGVLGTGLSRSAGAVASNWDWDQFMHVNLPNYIGDEQQGETELVGYLSQIYYNCYPKGQEPMVVLAGYSQGAMVVHNILNELAANPDTGYLSLIKGAVLIADPERMPWSDITNFGTASPGDYGICHTLDEFPIPHETTSGSCVPPNTTTDVAKTLSSETYQVCDTGDLVCDTSGAFRLNSHGIPALNNVTRLKLDYENGKLIHTTHYESGTVTVAARRVARNLIRDGLGDAPAPSPTPSLTPTPAPTPTTGTGSWTAAEAPLPAGLSDPNLYGVSCVSASQCVAVGEASASAYSQVGLLLTESGGSWTAAEAPLPPGGASDPYVSLQGVSCVSASHCVAVGSYTDSSGGWQGLLLTDSGGSWTAAEAPLPAGIVGPLLYGVSCVSASQCVAVGDTAQDTGLLLTESDGSWTAANAPLPAGVSDVSLKGVSCVSASQCLAVGYAKDASAGTYDGLLLTGSGGSWTVAEAPQPAELPSVYPAGVSCVSASQCVAVGSAEAPTVGGTVQATAGGTVQAALLLTGSGESWTAADAPLPAGASNDYSNLEGVSCVSASQCVAVGSAILTESGGSWTAADAPLPAGASYTSLWGVSCPSASHCVAVGFDGEGGLILTLG